MVTYNTVLFLPKIYCGPSTRGPQELGGPGSLNRLNPRFLRHCYTKMLIVCVSTEWPSDVWLHSSVTHLPAGTVTWRTSLSPVRVQVSP